MPSEVVQGFFDARRVALIGASDGHRDPGSYNARMTRALLESDLEDLVLVTRDGRPIDGQPTFATIENHAGGGDLCILAISEALLPEMVEAAISAGWYRLLVVSAQLSEPVKEHLAGVIPKRARLWGPNCLGFVDVWRRRRFLATEHVFEKREDRPRIAIISQSGGGGLSIAVLAEKLGFPPSHFAALGDEYDIATHDVLDYFARGRADTVVLFLEEARHPGSFLDAVEACQEAGIGVVVVKVGRTPRSRTMAQNHTGALVGDYDEFVAAVRKRGATVCRTVREAAVAAGVVAYHGRSLGRRVAFFGSSGGMAALAPDVAAQTGVALAEFSEKGLMRLRQLAAGRAYDVNPYDSANGGGTPRTLPAYLEVVGAERGVDMMIFMHNSAVYADFIVSELTANRPAALPIVAVWPDIPPDHRARLVDGGILIFEDLRDICGVLGLAWQDDERRGDQPPSEGGQAAPASEAEDEPLTYLESLQVLSRSGVPTPWRLPVREASGIDAAVEAVRERFPVVVKGANLRGHKALAGGVIVDIRDVGVLRGALEDLVAKFDGAVIEEQVGPGLDLLMAARRGPFGGIAVLGFGGVLADVLGRQLVLPVDLPPRDIEGRVRASSVGAVLQRFGGGEWNPASEVSRMITDICALLQSERLQEIELNPVVVGRRGAVACDAKVVRSAPGASSANFS
jgi:acyl-CoA synthetase (NDP forming)